MKFKIHGGKPLVGEIVLAGAKNAATKMMVTSLLTDEPVFLERFPRIGDTEITGELCGKVGTKIEWGEGSVKLHTPKIIQNRVTSLSRRNRLPILALGPLLARSGEAEVPILGGDKIGPRPVDLHVYALKALGAEIEVTPESYIARAPKGLIGAEINFPFISVGATENALLAAVLAKGKTKITRAALEPEIVDLIKLLQKMGAIIELGGSRNIFIEGVGKLHGARHAILPDRNEAVSFACLAIGTNGKILVRGARQGHMITFLNVVRRLGGEYEVSPEGISFWRGDRLKPIILETDAHPGFMTDWQQPLAVVLTQSHGVSQIHETIYEDRFGYIKDLNNMGADISAFADCGESSPCRFAGNNFNHRSTIKGPTPLMGSSVQVRDLRAGIAHVIAGLIAEGESELDGIEELDRGYEKLDERLRNLGADIVRI
ncbi:MAG: UDP-N-acetylglucosamine 1-carboxyvinyltransferase [Candidatus Liptonbacteria bacterium]|nr:UDP-N-acetylglucosamine 1-carboxyvinyltransferase [Candidatus Liptonbacteria bacterium]